MPFILFCTWYFFCSVRSGFYIEYASLGLIPFIVYIFMLMLRSDSLNNERLLSLILYISLPIAMVSVILWVIMSLEKGFIARAYFPFFYSNTTGIFFGVCYILASLSDSDFLKKAKYLFLFSLLTTMSVGAVAITYLAILATDRNKKRVLLYTSVCVVGALFMKERLIESGGTFTERLLQIHDGLMCTAANPLFGMGAGRWEYAKQIYQTGFYTAKLIHCSPVQICAESGILGGILFFSSAVTALFRIKGDKKSLVCALMLIVHCFFDFDLYFAAFGMLIAVLVCPAESAKDDRKSAYVAARIICAAFTVLFTVMALILSSVKGYENAVTVYGNGFAVSEYGATAARFSHEATELYAESLAASGQREEFLKVYGGMEYPSAKLIIQSISQSGKDDEEKKIAEYLEAQPFNTLLSRAVGEDEVSDKALAKMSYFGKKLYEMRGTNE